MLGGKPLLRHSLETFCRQPAIDHVHVVIAEGEERRFREISADLPLLPPSFGGRTRQESGYLGLQAVKSLNPAKVLIHDAARPFVSDDIVSGVLFKLSSRAGAVPALPVTETLKFAPERLIKSTVDRNDLWSAQTPQGFDYEAILQAHQKAHAEGLNSFTDDAAVAEWAGLQVAIVPGDPQNIKITSFDDLVSANERMMQRSHSQFPDFRTGMGYDVHAFESGDHVVLCGVKIAHTARLKGHSDADVALHALTDAILGTIGEGDIGTHFPATDEKWRGADSAHFLAHACRLLSERGGKIANVDITIVCETPKLAPHMARMRERLQSMLKLSPDRIGIKATTNERLGFIGRSEGIAAYATATIRLP